jgi:hypothetical protein
MHVLPLALLAACALGLAACGADDGGAPAAARSSEAEAKEARLKFAECMREHGIDFPDPGSGEGGAGPVKVGGDATPEELREAEEACKELREDIKPPELSEEQQQEFKEAALAHARCMREQGIDFPDPTFSEDGGARVRLGPGGVDSDDADLREAEEKCAGKLPSIVERRP